MTFGLMWFRRDLRAVDNAALHAALRECDRVYAAFCFDREILDTLEDQSDRRVDFIHQSLVELNHYLKSRGSSLIVRHGVARKEIPALAAELKVDSVYANHDYEPGPRDRDAEIARRLAADGRELKTFKDHVIFEKDDVLNKSGRPFRVYTQYKNAWRRMLRPDDYSPFACEKHLKYIARPPAGVKSSPWSLQDLGFRKTDLRWPGGRKAGRSMLDAFMKRINGYARDRDYTATDGVSHLSVHLRFGTISIREAVRSAVEVGSAGAGKWLDELIWREFYNMILHFFPHTEKHAFQEKFEKLKWRRDRKQFAAWCDGRTGYPIVDAAMRQLNTTGYMHNRLRMIAASFLTKDLCINWKWGERYFARKLLDYDLSQNLGGWQWTAGIGTDAQPYFRIMNPVSQSERYDAEGDFIRRYVPELARFPAPLIHAPWEVSELEQEDDGCIVGKDYPGPMVDHREAREASLAMFRKAKSRRG